MNVSRILSLLLGTGFFAGGIDFARAEATPPGTADYQREVLPVLQKYCWDCHGDGMNKGSVQLDKFTSLNEHFGNHELWLAVYKNVESQLMPPAKKDQPTDAERQIINRWIEKTVFKVDPENPDPGRVTIRRLNREEYRNTISDLLGVDFDTSDAFPADDTGYGFDTIGDVLNLSPILLEKYLDASEQIVSEVMKSTEGRVPVITVSGDKFKVKGSPDKNAKWLPFAQTATAEFTLPNPPPGKFHLTVDMRVGGSTDATVHMADLSLRVNGHEVEKRDLGWDNRKSILLEGNADWKKGPVTVSLHISQHQPPAAGENPLSLVVNSVSLQGPMDGSVREYPKDYYRVFMDGQPPVDPAARHEYARKILRRLADRAFRRPVDEAMLNRLVTLAENSSKQPGATFEQGIGHALTAILASPRFLFRAEVQPEPNNPGRVVPVDEFALASRLSYFLWSSLPDDELFNLAKEGKLRANLRAQVDRMLLDPRSDRFFRNFVGQWLETRDVTTINVNASRILKVKNEETGKFFSQNVRRAMREETDLMFAYLVKENRSALEFFTADYTFLNEPLAKFYGIPGVKGSAMRKVPLSADSHRGGVLTQASILVVTSNPTRTSPVKRGLFVLENLLGTPAPPPPPNVPPLEEVKKSGGAMTMREMMEIHRQKPLCAACHARMDPIGLGLENFNALGMWRDQENGKPIDTGGQLITGETFNNVAELSKILATKRHMDFYRCLAEKLMTYAIGRGPEYYDTPTIDRLANDLEHNGGKMKTLIYGIVESAPFEKRRGDGSRLEADAASGKVKKN